MDPKASQVLQTVFKMNINKSYLQLQHNKFNNKQEDKQENRIQEQAIERKVDFRTGRLTRVFDNPSSYTILKKEGYLYTKKESKGFWDFCVCNSGGKKQERVVIENRVLTVRGKDDRIVSTVNFDTASVKLKTAKNEITIGIKGYGNQDKLKEIYLETPPQESVEEWLELINRGIQGSQGDIYDLNYLAGVPNFLNTLSIPEKSFAAQCNSGDILLFKSTHGMAKVQRDLTGSEYDHIALILKNEKNEILLFESNSDTGVALSFWKDMLQFKWFQATERIVYRKLNVPRTEDFLLKFEEFIVDNIDKKFEVSLGKLLTFKSKAFNKQEHDQRTYFCSELVAKCYKHLGLLPESKSSTQYWPINFTEDRDLGLIHGSLGPQQLICFDKELCCKTD